MGFGLTRVSAAASGGGSAAGEARRLEARRRERLGGGARVRSTPNGVFLVLFVHMQLLTVYADALANFLKVRRNGECPRSGSNRHCGPF